MTDSSIPPSLTLLDQNGNTVKSWPLEGKRTYYIGRGKKNEVPLPYTWISRQHAMLQVEENGRFNILDLGSSNGTMVNGKRQHSAVQLHSGDKIQVGSTKTTLVFFHAYTPQIFEEQEDIDEETVAFLQTELVTILVCDIRNFTSLSETIGPEFVSNILTIWSKRVNELVVQHNGSIDKFIGDAVMATWSGADCLSENIHHAMQTALAISEVTTLLSSKLPNLPWPLHVGGAINTGKAVVGNIGVDGGRDYTVVGDVVNVTFRLEELTTKIGKDILLGANVSKYLTNKDNFFSQCQYIVKGKKEPVDALGCNFQELKEYLTNYKLPPTE